MLRDRLADLVTRQKAVQDALARLTKEPGLAPLHQFARQARESLEARAAVAALEAMEKGQHGLELLASRPPRSRASPATEAAAKKNLAEIQDLLDAQLRLRQEGEKLLAGAEAKPNQDLERRTDQLATDALKLGQGAEPGAARQAEEAARALAQARQAMAEARQTPGPRDNARGKEDEAALNLEMAARQLGKLGAPASTSPPSAAASSLREGMEQVRQARTQLGSEPGRAATSMQQAAQSLHRAAQQAQSQGASPAPPGLSAPTMPGPAAGAPVPLPREAAMGRNWGELPGELRNRLVQDLRGRYGEEYAEVIRRYFERLAAVEKK
jgi:hypothetical protein